MSDLTIPVLVKCQTCTLRKDDSFCNLPREALVELDRIKQIRTFARGDRLFDEGQAVDELMIVCEGAASLTFSSSTGNVVMLGFSERGEVLGLSSMISGRRHEISADALENTRVAAIARPDFLNLLERFPPRREECQHRTEPQNHPRIRKSSPYRVRSVSPPAPGRVAAAYARKPCWS